jgi:M6 family metalloprotease-like protein
MSLRRFVAPALLVAALIAPGHAAPDPEPEAIEGQLLTLWLDAPAGIAAPAPEHWLYRRGGDRVQLDVPAALRGVVLGLDRKPVRLRGRARPAAAGGPARLEVQHAQPAPAGAGATLAAWPEDATRGRRPWVNLLCAFPDASGEQRDPGFFTSMFSSTRPGLDYYWKELSNGQLSVAGTRTFGWYTLPQPHATYVRDGNLDFQLALNDCTGVADADVDFLDYSGVNLVFNASLGCCAWGGGGFVSRDGDTRIVGVTWMPDWAWPHHGVFGHEMGHGLGLPHSRSTYNVYGNPWDVMSDLWFNCHLATDPVIGCLGQHTIGYHKDRLGWVPDTARVTLAPGETRSVQLDKLERPTPGMHHLAVIPIHGSSGHYYTVEARRKYGFDAKLPGASVVIH